MFLDKFHNYMQILFHLFSFNVKPIKAVKLLPLNTTWILITSLLREIPPLLFHGSGRLSVHFMIHDITLWLWGCFFIMIRYVYREVNMVANWMVSYIVSHLDKIFWIHFSDIFLFLKTIFFDFFECIHINTISWMIRIKKEEKKKHEWILSCSYCGDCNTY